jgi:hypothetical protein
LTAWEVEYPSGRIKVHAVWVFASVQEQALGASDGGKHPFRFLLALSLLGWDNPEGCGGHSIFRRIFSMIDAMDLYRTLHRKPFQPFRVFLTDGRSYDIRFERNNVVGTTFFAIGIPSSEDPAFIAERTVRVPLEMIERVEDLRESPSSPVR